MHVKTCKSCFLHKFDAASSKKEGGDTLTLFLQFKLTALHQQFYGQILQANCVWVTSSRETHQVNPPVSKKRYVINPLFFVTIKMPLPA